jgi:predicted Zn-dependent protease with MMP-like domain
MFAVSRQRFEELVEEAFETLPEEFSSSIENLAVVVEDRAVGRPLYGLYEGIPLTKRSPLSYAAVAPDRITLYQETISSRCNDEQELAAQIRRTLIHEVGHYFGISDERLDELGWA